MDLELLLDEAFADGPLARTFAVVLIHQGRLIAQRYAHAIDHFDRPAEPITDATPLLSWSMAKSMLHAVVGMLVADGRLDLDASVDVP
ncbi:MAG: serine hydrolase, partial [Acidimicrobiales bacterium]|nr:serine hydrolase [Acidimicrobiales bacterium]